MAAGHTYTENEPDIIATANTDTFRLLMSASSKANNLPPKYANLVNQMLHLHNNVIDLLETQHVGFVSTNTGTLGKNLVNSY